MKKRKTISTLVIIMALAAGIWGSAGVPVYAHGGSHQNHHTEYHEYPEYHEEQHGAHHHQYVTQVVEHCTCTTPGKSAEVCSICGQHKAGSEQTIAPCHTYGPWETSKKATVFAPKVQTRTCTSCGDVISRNRGKKLTPKLTLSAGSLTLRKGQCCTSLKVTGMARGDYLKSVKSSRPGIVRVSEVNEKGTMKLDAGNKTGTAKLTVTLASGEEKTVTVRVKK